jgi:hypothetical protein
LSAIAHHLAAHAAAFWPPDDDDDRNVADHARRVVLPILAFAALARHALVLLVTGRIKDVRHPLQFFAPPAYPTIVRAQGTPSHDTDSNKRTRDVAPPAPTDAELRAAIAESRKVRPRWDEPEYARFAQATDATIDLLERVLADRDSVSAGELRLAEYEVRALGEWRLETYGYDAFADARARRLDLYQRLRAHAPGSAKTAKTPANAATTNQPQIANDHSPGRGTFPRWGIETGWGGDAHSAAMTPDTATAAAIFARNLKRAMAEAPSPFDYNAGLAREIDVKPKVVSEWIHEKAIASLPNQRALERAFAKPFGWFTADHEQDQ